MSDDWKVVREYGLERLRERGEAHGVARRHAHVFLYFARMADKAWGTPSEAEWLERLEVEHDNMRAALRWTLAHEPEA